MLALLATLRRLRLTRSEDGFTVLELLVVLIVVALLAGMAIPLFLNQQREAVDASIKADVHNTAADVLTWQNDHRGQKVDNTAEYVGKYGGRVTISRDDTYLGVTSNADGSYTVCAFNGAGNKFRVAEDAWTFDSKTGKFALTTTNSCLGAVDKDGKDASTTTKAPSWQTAAVLPRAERNASYSVALAADGKPAPTFELPEGFDLPDGLSLDPLAGVISGKPTETGIYQFTINAKNSVSTVGRMFTLTIVPESAAPVWNTGVALADAKQGKSYSAELDAVANPTATYELQAGSQLPNGLSLNKTSGKITGTPTESGDKVFTINAVNKVGTTPQTFFMHIVAAGDTTDPGTNPGTDPGDGDDPSSDPSDPSNPTGGTNPTNPPADPADAIAPEWKNVDTTLATGEQATAYTDTVHATGTEAPVYSVASGSKLPAGLKLNGSTGDITGTPTVYGDFSFTIVAKNSVGSASKKFSVTLGKERTLPVWTTDTDLGAAEQGEPFDATVQATAYPTPTYALQDGAQLPDGLKLNAATGEISGTPTVYGAESFTLVAKNVKGEITRTFTLDIASHRIVPVVTSAPKLVDGEQGEAYTAQIAASGNPAPTYALAAGSTLPAGLSLNKTTGAITGTPTVYGDFSFKITAKNSKGEDSQTFAVHLAKHRVAPQWTVDDTLVAGEQGEAYAAKVSATGEPQPTFAIGDDALPAGLSLNPASGDITGTPTVFGDFTFTIVATNSKGSNPLAFKLHLAKHRVTPEFTTDVTLPDGEQGESYATGVAATGEPQPTYALQSGTDLPAGLSLNTSSGAITGTPTVYGDFMFTVVATNSKGTASRTFFTHLASHRIAPVWATNETLATGEQGETYSATVVANGNPQPTLALASGSTLPAGLTFDAAAGAISGTPTVYGSFSFTVVATNSKGSASRTFNFSFAQHRVAPAFTTGMQLADGEQGEGYNASVSATGVPAPSYSLKAGSTMPDGLTFNSGTISGTPTVYGSFIFTVVATNSKGSAERTFGVNLAKHRVVPAWTSSASLPTGEQATSYSTTVAATGVPDPTLSLASGSSLPAGLTFDPATGAISGTPTVYGTFSFTLVATNSKGATPQTFSVTFAKQRVVPAFTTDVQLPAGEQAMAYSTTISASGEPQPTYALASGSTLPGGLAFNGATGVLSGTSTDTGDFVFTINATNSKGSASRTFFLHLEPRRVAPTWVTGAALPDGEAASAYATTISASGYPQPKYTLDANSTLPAGLALNASSGNLTGTPTTAGDYSFTINANNIAGTISRAFTLHVGITRVAPAFTTAAALPDGSQNVAYTAQVSASGYPQPTYSVTSGFSLPAGLSLDANSGVISGTPTGYGAQTFSLTATNSKGATTRTFTTNLARQQYAPNWTTAAALPDGTQNAAYSVTVAADAYPAVTGYAVATGSSLPTGFTLNTTTGAISGTSTTYGPNTFTLTATNSVGSTNRTFTLYFAPASVVAGTSGGESSDTSNSAWKTYNGGTSLSTASRSSAYYRTGGYSYAATNGYNNGNTYIAYTPASGLITKGKTYTVGAWVYVTGTTARKINVYYSRTGQSFGTLTTSGTPGWQQITGTFTAPFDYAAGSDYFYWQYDATTSVQQAFYLDDFSLVTDTTPANVKASFLTYVSGYNAGGYAATNYNFDASGTINASGSSAYTWTFGDGTSATYAASTTAATHAYTTAGTYTVKLVAQNGTGGPTDTYTSTVSVDPNATIYTSAENSDRSLSYFYAYSGTTKLSGTTIQISNSTNATQVRTGTGSMAGFYYSDSSNTNLGLNYAPPALTKGKTYQISAWVRFNDTTSRTLNLVSDSGAVLGSVTGTAASGWQQLTGSYTVPFGYTSGSTAIQFKYATPTTASAAQFYLDDVNFSTDSSPALVQANYTLSTTSTTSYNNTSYTFDASNSINASGSTAYTWDFGDGTTSALPAATTSVTHDFPTAGTYSVKLTVQNGTGGPTDTLTRTISTKPAAALYATAETNDANNASGYTVAVNSGGSNVGAVQSRVTTFAHTGMYAYYPSGYNGIGYFPNALVKIGKTYQVSAWVYTSGTTARTITLNDQNNAVLATLSNQTSTSGWQQLTANWTVPFNYSSGGTYLRVVSTGTDLYVDDLSMTTDASPALSKAAITGPTVAASGTSGYSNQSYTFSSANSQNAAGTAPYTWDFGDGTAQVATTATSVTHAYTTAGTYTVRLTVQNGDGGPSDTTTTTVSASPSSAIYASSEVTDPNRTLFAGYGDSTYGYPSTSQASQDSTYAHTGVYSYRSMYTAYTCTSSAYYCSYYPQYSYFGGTTSGFWYTPAANVLKVGKTYAISAWIYNPSSTNSTVSLYDPSSNRLAFTTLNVSNGWSQITANYTVPFNWSQGNSKFLFQSSAGDRFYLDDMALTTDASPALPNAAFTLSAAPATGSTNATAYTFDASSSVNAGGSTPYTWDFGDGSDPVSSTATTTSHTYTAAGTYTVKLSVLNADGGQTSTTTKTVSVDPAAAIYINAENGDTTNHARIATYYGSSNYFSGTSIQSTDYAHTGQRSYYSNSYYAEYGNYYGMRYYPGDKVSIGKTYAFSAWVYNPSGSVSNMSVTDSLGTAVVTKAVASGAWTQLTGSWTVPFTYNNSTSGTYLRIVSTSNYAFYLDDVDMSTDSSPALTNAVFNLSANPATNSLNTTSYTFNASASQNTAGTTPYTWDFGDGITQVTTTSSVTHDYAADAAGTYTVKLTTQNGDGGPTATTQKTISISPSSTIYANAESGDNYNHARVYAYYSSSNYVNGGSLIDTGYAHTGQRSYYSNSYYAEYNNYYGMRYYPGAAVAIGKTYAFSAWVYNPYSTAAAMSVTDSLGTAVATKSVPANTWTQITGNWTVPFAYNNNATSGTYLRIVNTANNPFYLDDMSMATDASPAATNAVFSLSVQPATNSLNATTYTFNASASQNTAGSTPYTWDFGDGTAAQSTTATSINHAYTAAGTYTVKLTTQNGDGGPTATTQKTVSVDPSSTIYASAENGDTYNHARVSAYYSSSSYVNGGSLQSTTYAHTGQYSYYSNTYYADYGNYYGMRYYAGDAVSIGKTYTFSAWVYNPYSTAAAISVTDSLGTAVATKSVPTSAWTRVTGSWTVPFAYNNSATSGTYLRIVNTANNYFYVDDISMATDSSPALTNAAFSLSASPATNSLNATTYAFNASASQNYAGSTPFTWDFGDGTTQVTTATTTSHAYTAAGTYTVKLTTQNGDTVGAPTSSVTKTVSVDPAATINMNAENGDSYNDTNVRSMNSSDNSSYYAAASMRNSTYAHTGQYSYYTPAYANYSSNYGMRYYPGAALAIGKTYTFSAWVYQTASATTTFTVNDTLGTAIATKAAPQNTWTQVTGSYTVPFAYSSSTVPNGTALRFYNSTNVTFYMDDMVLKTDASPALTNSAFTLSAAPATNSVNATAYSFDASASQNASGTTPYTWDFGDGTVQSTTSATITHDWAAAPAGTYTVKLTTQNGDSAGAPTSSTAKTVTVNPQATVNLTGEAGDAYNSANARTLYSSGTNTFYNGESMRNATYAHSGQNSYYANNYADYSSTIGMRYYGGTALKPGKTYQFSAWVYQAASATTTFTVNDTLGTAIATKVVPQNAWTQITGSYTVPFTYNNSTVVGTGTALRFYNSGNVAFYLDDMQLVTDASAATPLSSFTFQHNTSALNNSQMYFDGSASINAAGSTPYTWNFGDGTTQVTTGATVTHTYASAGTYTPTLSVQNGDGGPVASSSKSLSVNPGATTYSTAETSDGNTASWKYASSSSAIAQLPTSSAVTPHTGISEYLVTSYADFNQNNIGARYYGGTALKPGKTYAISAWVYMTQPTGNRTVQVVSSDNTGTVLGSVTGAAGTWQQLTGSYTVPYTYNSAVSTSGTALVFSFATAATTYAFYMDDIAFTTDSTPATPSASFTYSPSGNAAYLFNAAASQNVAGTAPYTWDFGDGTTQSTASATISHTYASSGAFTAKLTVQDTDGGPTASTTTTVNALLPGVTVASTTAEDSDSANWPKVQTYNIVCCTYVYTYAGSSLRTTAQKHSGSYSYSNYNGGGHPDSTSGEYGERGVRFTPGASMTANNKYTITAWVSSPGGSNNYTAYLKDLSGNTLASGTTYYTSGSWTQLTATYTTPSNWDPSSGFFKITDSSGYTMYVDDISIVSQ